MCAACCSFSSISHDSRRRSGSRCRSAAWFGRASGAVWPARHRIGQTASRGTDQKLSGWGSRWPAWSRKPARLPAICSASPRWRPLLPHICFRARIHSAPWLPSIADIRAWSSDTDPSTPVHPTPWHSRFGRREGEQGYSVYEHRKLRAQLTAVADQWNALFSKFSTCTRRLSGEIYPGISFETSWHQCF